MKGFTIGIRAKLLFFSSFLLVIPYMSYQYVWQLETYLRIGQEQTLVGTARAVATALHERPALFDNQSAFLSNITPGTDLYAHRIQYPIKLDGKLGDWQDYQDKMITYGATNLVEQSAIYSESSLSFTHMVGQYDKFLYAMFEVSDDNVLLRPINSLRVDRNDYLQIALINAVGEFERYIISPYEAGWVNAYRLDISSTVIKPVELETRIQGQWETTPAGYTLELRFPLSMLSSKIAFAVGDVDDTQTRRVKYLMGTANPSQSESLGTVLVPSPEIERIIKGLQYSGARVWVLDKHMRVLARSGNIQQSQGISGTGKTNTEKDSELWRYLENRILLPLYYKILTKPPADFIDDLADAFALEGRDIANALDGDPSTLWRLSSDNKAVILSAAHPIFIDNQVMGAVVVEQTTHGIRSLRNQALEKQFHFILAIILIATFSLFLFASRISNRIRKLRDETESAIDVNGKIVGTLKLNKSGDEIGDLSRSFTQVLSKLSQYNQYLENMASRLSHELRTPVAVVNSSLDNLEMSQNEEDRQEYIGRAKAGIKRLSKILNSMSEATRLEQSINNSEAEDFDIVPVLAGCIKGYEMTFDTANLALDIQIEKAPIKGSPEMFAQMLDKVVTNAVEFKQDGTNINVRLFKKEGNVALSVTNSGPILPDNMHNQLLNSMISIRKSTSAEQSHLGLGLYVANIIAEYHGAKLSIDNLPDHSGVIVLLEFG
ncbi:MAG: dedicated sortase system histidine kinase [Alphaproteobacteria bacterium]|jgi:dedicated sortase system histidine kinase